MPEITLPYQYTPRSYQMPVWRYFENGGKRAACIWHRRAGKDLFAVNLIATKAMQRRGLYWHLFPTYNQGRKIAWDGFTKDGRAFMEYFPKEIVASKNATDMRVELINGSIYQVVGTDNVDRLVGSNPVGVVLSEYSLQDPRAWNLLRPILGENEGWALFIYTPRGKNHGWDLLVRARKNPNWFSECLDIDQTKAIPYSVVEEDRMSGMPEELIQQEYYTSFEASLVGAFYSQQMATAAAEKRIGKVPWEPRLKVDTAWDLGMDDSTAIWFFQMAGMECRIIDYYENSGEGIPHYAKILNQKPYVYGRHLAPCDIEVRELGSGKSRLETAKSLGIRFTVVKKHEIEDGIEGVRSFLPKCWFDEEKCGRAIEALKQYRKEWDDKRMVFRATPLHDWTSHASDAFRYLVMGSRDRATDKRKSFPSTAEMEYNVFSYQNQT